MSLDTLLGTSEQKSAPFSAVIPLGEFGVKELRRIVAVQLVIQLTGGISDPDSFIEYVDRVERYIEVGMLRSR